MSRLPEEPTQEELRLEKLLALQQAGRDPFAHHTYSRTHLAEQVAAGFETLDGQTVAVCGRVMTRRAHGKSTFMDLVDASGKIQVYGRLNDLGEEPYAAFGEVDLGDIIGVRGEVFKTRTEEVTVKVTEWVLLSKALRPLPEKWHGLTDTEARYRHRYLDLAVSPESRDIFARRARMVQAVRELLYSRGFQEVETPILQPLYGGANARPFITHHNALEMQLYMRIAPELYLKRLVVGGLERVFEIGKCFRNEGIDSHHNPEFTILEAYQAYADYHDMMELVESLVCAMGMAANGCLQFTYRDHDIDLTPPWRRVTMFDAIREATGIDFSVLETDEQARAACAASGHHLGDIASMSLAELMGEAFDNYVQPDLIQPTFVTDYPVAISPLAKRLPGDPNLTARFEPFMGGEEIGNAFSELNDPLDQRARFEAQIEAGRGGDEEAHPLDEDFLRALEHGLPPTGGMGLGIDRLAMLLCGRPSIREVVLFPTLRPREE